MLFKKFREWKCILSVPPQNQCFKKMFKGLIKWCFIYHFVMVLKSWDVSANWTKSQRLNALMMEKDCRAILLILEREDLPTESFVYYDYKIKTRSISSQILKQIFHGAMKKVHFLVVEVIQWVIRLFLYYFVFEKPEMTQSNNF